MKKIELGISTFAEVMEDPFTNEKVSYDKRINQVIEEIKTAEDVGIDHFGIGEHHRHDFAASAPQMILAGAATQTSTIKLSSAVSVLSSDDPVRLYQQYATLNALSNGRAELMVGRGSFIESFPLFGHDLHHYDDLFEEKLELLLKIRDNEFVSHQGTYRPSFSETGIYPRNETPLDISVAVGGTRQSIMRAARYGLPLFLAIIGGNPLDYKVLIDLYKKEYEKHGHDPQKRFISVHSHGYIDEDHEQALNDYFPSIKQAMNIIGEERGWPPYTYETYERALSEDGALYVGDPAYVAKKINHTINALDLDRFTMHVPVGPLDHDKVLNAIRLYGKAVKPLIKKK